MQTLCEPVPRVLGVSVLTFPVQQRGTNKTKNLIPILLRLKGLVPKTYSLKLSSPEHFTKMDIRPFQPFKLSQQETDGKMWGFLEDSNPLKCSDLSPN